MSSRAKSRQDQPHPDKTASAAPAYVINRHRIEARKALSGLHIVATPIGNLGDITLRAIETLAGVDLIACEDTRVTRHLLDRFQISTPMTAYHDHNAAAVRPKLIGMIEQGQSIALVSDAGTPLISDPGYRLVRELTSSALPVVSIPGPSSVMAALSVAGLPTDRFLFEGFLSTKDTARRKRIAELALIDATLVVFESGSRIGKTLGDLADCMPDREAAICREMTKLHEEIRRGRLPDLTADAAAMETRGEFVVVIGPPSRDANVMSEEMLDDILAKSLKQLSVRDAVAEVVRISGRPRRDVYARALALSEQDDAGQDRLDG